MTEELEQLAVQLAALPDRQREVLAARVRDLLQVKRAVGRRLRGTSATARWGAIVAGGLLYDADGAALARVEQVHMHKEARDGPRRDHRREVTIVNITAQGLED